ncbi:hypothetical protein BDV12DRAFT_175861 [Aspergillus spectabilis]
MQGKDSHDDCQCSSGRGIGCGGSAQSPVVQRPYIYPAGSNLGTSCPSDCTRKRLDRVARAELSFLAFSITLSLLFFHFSASASTSSAIFPVSTAWSYSPCSYLLIHPDPTRVSDTAQWSRGMA